MSAPYATGWVQDLEAVGEIVAQLSEPAAFADAPPSELPESVYLWKAREKLTGMPWPARNQGQVGSCVSFGTAAAIEATICAQRAAGSTDRVVDLVQEIIYAGSRVEVGNKRIRGDGSIGAWAAEFANRWGVLARGRLRSYDLAAYDPARCRAWGDSGVPDDLEPDARQHPAKSITQVRTWTEAQTALARGYGVAVCSGQGFSMVRGADGFAKPSGTWNHCMALLGYQTGKREGGWICNSWGPSAHTGPVGAGNPPTCGFWADAQIVDKMLRGGDSWAFSSVVGFPGSIDWRI